MELKSKLKITFVFLMGLLLYVIMGIAIYNYAHKPYFTALAYAIFLVSFTTTFTYRSREHIMLIAYKDRNTSSSKTFSVSNDFVFQRRTVSKYEMVVFSLIFILYLLYGYFFFGNFHSFLWGCEIAFLSIATISFYQACAIIKE